MHHFMKRSAGRKEKNLPLLRAEFLVEAPISPPPDWLSLESLDRDEIPTVHARTSPAPKDILPQRVLHYLKLA